MFKFIKSLFKKDVYKVVLQLAGEETPITMEGTSPNDCRDNMINYLAISGEHLLPSHFEAPVFKNGVYHNIDLVFSEEEVCEREKQIEAEKHTI